MDSETVFQLDPSVWRAMTTSTDDNPEEVMTESPQRPPRSAQEVRRVHQRWLERRSVRLGAALDGVERFVVMGAAGGSVASLAIVCAIIGAGKLIDMEFYVVLAVFMIGLLFSWVGRYLDVILAVDIRRSSSVWISLYYIRRTFFWTSAIAVMVGSLLGMIELYGFTR